ncbi:MAG TPA: PAS domain S-box protein [bacterium]|nr:PAS domain S-box protein [bacterium]
MPATGSTSPTPTTRAREPWFLRSKSRLYLVLLLALAIPGAAFSALVAFDVKRELREQAERENALAATMVTQLVEEQFYGLRDYVRSYADRIRFSESVCRRDTVFARRVLDQMRAGSSLISRVFLTDTGGVLWLDTPVDPQVHGRRFAHRDWYRGVHRSPRAYVSEMYRRDALGQPYTIAVAAMVYDDGGNACGILVAQVTVENLAEWLLDLRLSQHGIATLIDPQGHWIDNAGHGVHPARMMDTTTFRHLIAESREATEGRDPLSGAPSLVHVAPVSGSDWTVVARRSLRDVYAPAHAMQRTIFLYFAIGLLGMVVIGGSMYRTLRRHDAERDQAQEEMRRAYRDVEERVRQRTEELARANRELSRLAGIVECSYDAIGSATLDGVVTSWNPAAERIYGYRRDEVIGQHSSMLLPPERAGETAGILRRIVAGELLEPFESVRRRKDGQLIDMSLTYSPVRDETGAITGVAVIARDITRQKRMEAQAQRLEQERAELLERLQMTLERMPIGCILHDTEFCFTYWNPAAERIFGYRLAEVMGRSPFGLITTESSQDATAAALRRLAAGEEHCDEVGENLTRDGRRIICIWHNTSLRSRDGAFLGVISMCQDITEQKRDEERLRHYAAALAQTNRELRDFAFVASHDLQEPLRKILAFGERLEAHAGAALDEDARDSLDRMQNAARRMQTLISDLLDFSRVTTQAQPFAPVDLNAVVAEALSDLEARVLQTGGRVQIGPLPTIEADRVQMRQLFQNVIGNALKFHDAGRPPEITVSARRTAPPDPSAQPADWCEITFADNGIGFDARFAERIFTPFIRLHGRQEYEGTGMGLAICRKIVERHGGTITASGRPGSGATFRVLLPACQSPARPELWTTIDHSTEQPQPAAPSNAAS